MVPTEKPGKSNWIVDASKDIGSIVDYTIQMGVSSVVPNAWRKGPLKRYHLSYEERTEEPASARWISNVMLRNALKIGAAISLPLIYGHNVSDSENVQQAIFAASLATSIVDFIVPVVWNSSVEIEKNPERRTIFNEGYEPSMIPLDLTHVAGKQVVKYVKRLGNRGTPDPYANRIPYAPLEEKVKKAE